MHRSVTLTLLGTLLAASTTIAIGATGLSASAASQAPTITGVTVSVPPTDGIASPLNGTDEIPYGQGFDSATHSLLCTSSPTTVTLTGTNLSASDTVVFKGFKSARGQFPTTACNITSTGPDNLSFTVATGPTLPTPAGYAQGLPFKGSVTVSNGTSLATQAVDFASACGAFPAPNAPGKPGTAAGTTSEGDANTVWEGLRLQGTGKDDEFYVGGFEEIGVLNQPLCPLDVGRTGNPYWADNFPVEIQKVGFQQTSTTKKGSTTIEHGSVVGAGFSFTYEQPLPLSLTKLTTTWTLTRPSAVTVTGCKVTSVPGETGTARTSCSVSGSTVTVVDSVPVNYATGDVLTSPTFSLTGVSGPQADTVKLTLGATSTTVTVGDNPFRVIFAPYGARTNGAFVAPNGSVVLTRMP